MINNLLTVFYMMILLGIAIFINTTLGALKASKKKEFNFKKLLNGVLKGIILTLCVLLLSLSLELLPVILGRVGIEIPSDFTNVIEIVFIGFTAYKKYVLDSIAKIKKLLNVEEGE